LFLVCNVSLPARIFSFDARVSAKNALKNASKYGSLAIEINQKEKFTRIDDI